ncbi:MAG: type II toxin-antitoxin system PemK/MazF family toxin [Chloroflexi bacterium]|nr:MAG: type II toxin-antitoxin system PemK/MazF family toxin [Chloroflexota bacterium]
MGRFVKGDVVILPFPFSDLTGSKRRPALVIAPLEAHDDLILCMITSRRARDNSAIPVGSADFQSGALPRESNIRPNRLFTAEGSIIIRLAGHLSSAKVDEVVREIVRIIS